MRTGVIGLVCLALSAGFAAAQTPSPTAPTPATRGRNPGAAATDAVTSPTRPPAEVAPRTPAPPPMAPLPAAPVAAASGPMSNQEMRDMLEAARATAKATREAVDYNRVVPDILTQILAKLDKLEDKLDKVENAVKASAPPGRRR